MLKFRIYVVAVAGIALLGACSGPDGTSESLDSPGVEAVAAQNWEQIKMNAYNYADTVIDSFGHFTTTPNGCHQDAEGALNLALWNQLAKMMNRALSKPLLPQANEACFPRPDGNKLYGTIDVIVDPPSQANALAAADSDSPHPAPFPSIPWPFPSWLPNPFAPDPSPTPVISVSPSQPTPTWSPTSRPTPTHSPIHSPSASPSPSPSGIKETLFENDGDQICTTIQDSVAAHDLLQAFDQISAMAYREDCPQAQ